MKKADLTFKWLVLVMLTSTLASCIPLAAAGGAAAGYGVAKDAEDGKVIDD